MRTYLIPIIFFILLLLSVSGCFKNEFGGLGIQVPFGDGKVTSQNPYKIVAVFKGGTAEQAGLKKNDIIISVDSQPLLGKKHSDIVNNLLRGKVGTIAVLEIDRKGTKIVVRVPRGRIMLQE